MTSQWFGDYEIVKRLRVGGMATLYLARRHGAAGFARLVALKMVHPHLATQPSFIEMFVDEARICAQISHPNVVHVEEFGVIDDVHYLVMEYLDGCSIGELLQVSQREGRQLDPELAARIIMQVSAGLHAAHETRDQDGQPLDIVHRDISPSNVFLSIGGNAKLIDFGIARARNRLSETQAGITLKGKCRYVAPEQATRTAVDRRCDIFSLGVVFWEMLVGQPLFVEDGHVGLFNRLHQTEVAPPSTLNPRVSPLLDSIVLAMLQHDPDQRPPTAAEVQRRIASAVPGAANREASEVGALATEVRDQREARRVARHGTVDPSGADSGVSFSPTPRSLRPGPDRSYRIELEPVPRSTVGGSPATLSRNPPWWTRRGVQVGFVAVLVIGGVTGLLLAGHGGMPEVSAAGAPDRHAPTEAAIPVEAPKPIPPAMRTLPALQATAPSPPPVPALPPTPSPPLPLARPAAQVGEAAASTISTSLPGAAASHPQVKWDPGHVATRPKPVLRRTVAPDRIESPGRPGSAARPVQVVNGKQPFANVPFDDADNERAAPAGPGTAKLKKAPIVDGFDR